MILSVATSNGTEISPFQGSIARVAGTMAATNRLSLSTVTCEQALNGYTLSSFMLGPLKMEMVFRLYENAFPQALSPTCMWCLTQS